MDIKLFQTSSKWMFLSITRYVILSTVFEIEHMDKVLFLESDIQMKMSLK